MSSSLRPRARRLGGRLVTGPLAFGVAGILDLLAVLRLLLRYAVSRSALSRRGHARRESSGRTPR